MAEVAPRDDRGPADSKRVLLTAGADGLLTGGRAPHRCRAASGPGRPGNRL